MHVYMCVLACMGRIESMHIYIYMCAGVHACMFVEVHEYRIVLNFRGAQFSHLATLNL